MNSTGARLDAILREGACRCHFLMHGICWKLAGNAYQVAEDDRMSKAVMHGPTVLEFILKIKPDRSNR